VRLPLLSGLLRRHRARGDRWSTWARALAGAHAPLTAAWPGTAMLLFMRARARDAREPGSLVNHRLELGLRLVVGDRERPGIRPARPDAAPRGERVVVQREGARTRLVTHVTHPPARPATLVVARPWDATAPPAPAPVAESPRPGKAAEAGILTVRRLVEERRRVEHSARSLPPSGQASTGVDPVTGWPVPLEAPDAPAVLRAHGEPRREAPAAAGEPRRPRSPEPAVATPPIDIDGLADQVVRQIDRRIVAHRERVGRI